MAEQRNDEPDGVKMDTMVRRTPPWEDDREGALHVGARDKGRGHRRRGQALGQNLFRGRSAS